MVAVAVNPAAAIPGIPAAAMTMVAAATAAVAAMAVCSVVSKVRTTGAMIAATRAAATTRVAAAATIPAAVAATATIPADVAKIMAATRAIRAIAAASVGSACLVGCSAMVVAAAAAATAVATIPVAAAVATTTMVPRTCPLAINPPRCPRPRSLILRLRPAIRCTSVRPAGSSVTNPRSSPPVGKLRRLERNRASGGFSFALNTSQLCTEFLLQDFLRSVQGFLWGLLSRKFPYLKLREPHIESRVSKTGSRSETLLLPARSPFLAMAAAFAHLQLKRSSHKRSMRLTNYH